MSDPLFWLGLSLFLVAVSLTSVLIVALPTLQELGRAARSAEKLFDTLNREFPPTLEVIRLTGMEISELSEDIDQGVEAASGVVKQVDLGLNTAKQQVQQATINTRGWIKGLQTAWQTWKNPRLR